MDSGASLYSLTSSATNTSLTSSSAAYRNKLRHHQQLLPQFGAAPSVAAAVASVSYLNPASKSARRKVEKRLSTSALPTNGSSSSSKRHQAKRCAHHNNKPQHLQNPISAQQPRTTGYAQSSAIRMLSASDASSAGWESEM